MAVAKTTAVMASYFETHQTLSHTCTFQISQMMIWGSTNVSQFTAEEMKIM